MSLETRERIGESFRAATRESLVRTLRTPEDWSRFVEITAEAADRLDRETAAFARDRPARIADAKVSILREENGLRLDQPLPPGVAARSDAAALTRKAEIRVAADHDRRRAVIRRDELDRWRDLAAEIRARDAPGRTRETPMQDRSRSGPSRD